MGDLRVLSSGVDTLHVSAGGTVRAEVWDELDAARNEAAAGEPGPVELGDTGQVFEVQPHGWRFYGLWLRSPDYELMLGRNEKFPAAVAQLHSAYLHSMGVWSAVGLVESTLRRAVLVGPGKLCVSRIDLYADVQGWPLWVEDMGRFVSRGRYRGGYPVGEEDGSERFWCLGRELTGFDFGRRGGPVYVRIYDKTTEIRRRGLSWLPDLWGGREADEPVWRVEAEVRRRGLVDLQLRRRKLLCGHSALRRDRSRGRERRRQGISNGTFARVGPTPGRPRTTQRLRTRSPGFAPWCGI